MEDLRRVTIWLEDKQEKLVLCQWLLGGLDGVLMMAACIDPGAGLLAWQMAVAAVVGFLFY